MKKNIRNMIRDYKISWNKDLKLIPYFDENGNWDAAVCTWDTEYMPDTCEKNGWYMYSQLSDEARKNVASYAYETLSKLNATYHKKCVTHGRDLDFDEEMNAFDTHR